MSFSKCFHRAGSALMVIACLVLTGCSATACAKRTDDSGTATAAITQRTYSITSAAGLDQQHLNPGDTVILQNGNWKDQQLVLKASGKEGQPIILKAETPGKVLLTGHSGLRIDGAWLEVSGLSFVKGYSLKEDVIVFSKTSAHCRLTQTSITGYNPPDRKTDYKWVSLYGTRNKVDHCAFTGKTHQGTTLVVWLSGTPNYHEITNNYFGPRPSLGNNGGETIRIGTSDWSMHDSYTTVTRNVFDRCDGEIEVISIKSGHNTIKENLFYECDGTLTFRHGNFNTVTGNYFIGNQKPNTGGIRVIGEQHTVNNNYLYGLTGTGLRASIAVMNAVIHPKLNEYWQVKQAMIDSNIIIGCKEAFALGAGKNETRVVPPENVTLQNNFVLNPGRLITGASEQQGLNMLHNKVGGAATAPGFEEMAPGMLLKNENNIWQLEGVPREPFWLKTTVGPAWDSAVPRKFVIR